MGEAVHADVQLRPGQPVTEEQLIAYCRKKLSAQKVPATLEMVAEIKTTSSGKVRHG
jgi:acyl-CoA synthetase (AMP-forming)/AMP-acid ligase II